MTGVKLRFNKRGLTADERPRFLFHYFVTGRGSFPFDMLRYDACWPANSDAASKMDYDPMRQTKSFRSVEMHSFTEPTVERWASFLWSVGLERLDDMKFEQAGKEVDLGVPVDLDQTG